MPRQPFPRSLVKRKEFPPSNHTGGPDSFEALSGTGRNQNLNDERAAREGKRRAYCERNGSHCSNRRALSDSFSGIAFNRKPLGKKRVIP